MQFKVKGKKILVLAYQSYDKVKKRAIVKMFGSIDRDTYEPSVGLLKELTDSQKKELQLYIDELRRSDHISSRQHSLDHIHIEVKNVADAIESSDFEITDAWAVKLYAEIDNLTKVTRKAGFARPKKAT